MAHGHKEHELLVQIYPHRPFMAYVRQYGRYVRRTKLRDEYFSPKKESFITERPISQWLRIRTSSSETKLTYKKWQAQNHIDGFSTEYETVLSDRSSLRNILVALQFEPIVTVVKTRTIYRIESFEVAFDVVDGLGTFVEVELMRSVANPTEAKREIVHFLKKAGCKKIERFSGGYPYMILFPHEIQRELL